MAIVYPDIKTINNLMVAPTPGEYELLHFLIKNLSDDFEVYFQPFLNGDEPDIILMKKGSGVMIIEVKDWNLNSYQLDENKNWILKNIYQSKREQQIIKSPLKQVRKYKENIFNLHIEDLLEKKIRESKYFAIVSCAVYFSNANEDEINTLLKNDYIEDDKYIKDLSYVDLIGYDNLTEDNFNKIISKRRLNNKSWFFDDNLYNKFKRILLPPIHTLEQGVEIKYTEKQLELSKSSSIQQKIKGFAGSGKTIILSKRAVNAHKRTSSKILILTFNITLRNYIHDNISKVREDFDWNNFVILHYHQFVKSEANNQNIDVNDLSDYDNENLFNGYEDQINKYKAVFIDEIQDYKTQWIRIIKKYFLVENGEFVVFGDEKQNIYERDLYEDKRPNTTITGRWFELRESFRLSNKITNLSTRFQALFFKEKYDLDIFQEIKQQALLSEEEIEYHYLNKGDKLLPIINYILNMIRDKKIHSNDICFLSSNIDFLRNFDFVLRTISKEKTETTFETKEDHDRLFKKNINNPDDELDRIRNSKKFNFWMNRGVMKLSTIHSFKGWEISTLFLIINDNDDTDELIYTATTRCRHRLFIINIGNQKYDDFFKQNNDLFNKII